MSDDTLARLAVCDAEAHAALHALGVERPDSDAEIALACSEADAETSPSAVLITGNPKYIKDNPAADKFYEAIEQDLKAKGYTVRRDPGEPYTSPPNANLWIGHSRGADRLRFAPSGTRTLAFGSNAKGAINHPDDVVEMSAGHVPPAAHYVFTPEMADAIHSVKAGPKHKPQRSPDTRRRDDVREGLGASPRHFASGAHVANPQRMERGCRRDGPHWIGRDAARRQEDAMSSGVKHDGGKRRFSLLPWAQVSVVVDVLEFGARKYAVGNWQKVPDASARGDRGCAVKILYLEGGHGVGTSTHADALAASLRALGHDAVAYHHPRHPDGATGLARVRWYIDARRELRRTLPTAPRMDRPRRVVVSDRGPWSGLVYARAVGCSVVEAAMDCALWGGAPLYLDAPDATLDARLLLRGEDPASAWPERAEWRRLAAAEDWPTIDTSAPVAEVTRALLRLAVAAVGGVR